MDNRQRSTTTTAPCQYRYSDSSVARAIRRSRWRKSKSGLLSVKFSNMRQRCRGEHKKRYEGLDLLPRHEFIEWAMNDTTFVRLFEEWHTAGCPYRLTPSIDRIDSTAGYTVGNLRFLTHSENSRAGIERYWRE